MSGAGRGRSETRESSVSREAWERFLAILHADSDRAAEQYELLHRKLVRFFEARGAASPPDAADVTIDRVVSKIHGGAEIQDLGNYCYGVARLVLLECGRQASRFEPLGDRVVVDASTRLHAGRNVMRECFEDCLRGLPADAQHMIVQYYAEDKQAKIDARRKLAGDLGLPVAGLRLKAHRIRARLETCIDGCMKNQRG